MSYQEVSDSRKTEEIKKGTGWRSLDLIYISLCVYPGDMLFYRSPFIRGWMLKMETVICNIDSRRHRRVCRVWRSGAQQEDELSWEYRQKDFMWRKMGVYLLFPTLFPPDFITSGLCVWLTSCLTPKLSFLCVSFLSLLTAASSHFETQSIFCLYSAVEHLK